MGKKTLTFDEVPTEGYRGCPFIRVCPYMTEDARKLVEKGEIIPKPVVAWVKNVGGAEGTAYFYACKYDAARANCSYPISLVQQQVILAEMGVAQGELSGLATKVSYIPTTSSDETHKVLEAVERLNDRIKRAAEILSGQKLPKTSSFQ